MRTVRPLLRPRRGSSVVLAGWPWLVCAGGQDGPSAAATRRTPAPTSRPCGRRLTVATSDPAFPPYVINNDPTNGKGFESAVAYAVADEMGFAEADVEWTFAGFNQLFAPGDKEL